MKTRKPHHLPDEAFHGQPCVVSLTICSATRATWLHDRTLAAIVCDEILNLHHSHPIIGFCLMPDHLHLLMATAGVSLSRIIGRFKGRCSRRIRLERPDLEVWQRDYWDHIVRRNEGIEAALEYMFMNPVRAGFTERWWDYPWIGSPLLGKVTPEMFGHVHPKNTLWNQLLECDG